MALVETRDDPIAPPQPVPPYGRPVTMPSTDSNILALPLVEAIVVTGNNEDWIDTFQFLVENGTGDSTTYPQLDLRGIDFKMIVRRQAGDHEVIVEASTTDGTMAVGAPPNYGFLILYVPLAGVMEYKSAGTYVADIVATDGIFTITVIQIALTIFEGVTK